MASQDSQRAPLTGDADFQTQHPQQWETHAAYDQYGQYNQGNQYDQSVQYSQGSQYNQGPQYNEAVQYNQGSQEIQYPQYDQHNQDIYRNQYHQERQPNQVIHHNQYEDERQPNQDKPHTQDLQQDTGHRVIAALKTRTSFWRKLMREAKWARYLVIVISLQAVIGIILASYTMAKWERNLIKNSAILTPEVSSERRTIPTMLTFLLFGFIYQLFLTWDALRLKNTIQIIGLVIANLVLMIYNVIQLPQIDNTIQLLREYGIFKEVDLGHEIKAMSITLPCIIAVTTAAAAFIAWKLYQAFAWDMLKTVGADYRMRQRYFHYQIYITLLKFDFFFFVCFACQFLVVVRVSTDVQTGTTIATLPIIFVTLIAAAYFTRKEWKWGVAVVIVVYLVGIAYYIFMVVRMFDPTYASNFKAIRKTLTIFAAFCFICIIASIVYAVLCMLNFGKGLREQLEKPRPVLDKDQSSYAMSDVKQPAPQNQFTID